MDKAQKWWVIGGTVVVVLLLASGGLWWWLAHKDDTPQQSSPNSQAATPNQSGALSVSGGTSLGQLNQDKTQTGTSSTSNTNDVDPSSFSQYEKYKTSSEALFAEIKQGNGTQLTGGMKAAVTYTGYLTDGQIFDTTNRNGQQQPFLFTLGTNEVISGFEQGIAGMKVGGKRLIIVPPSVGYGDKAQGSIPANSVLIFVIELQSAQ
jgi:FKBP-type peptidyl-prolyl cis-trans isomerase